MAVEQPVPEGPRIEVTALTEKQLCNPGAVKLMYKQFTELQASHRGMQTELATERQRNDTLVAVFEDITASKGFVDFWNRAPENFTIFHVKHEGD